MLHGLSHLGSALFLFDLLSLRIKVDFAQNLLDLLTLHLDLACSLVTGSLQVLGGHSSCCSVTTLLPALQVAA